MNDDDDNGSEGLEFSGTSWSMEERQAYLDNLKDEDCPLFATDYSQLSNSMAEAMRAISEEGESEVSMSDHYKSLGNLAVSKGLFKMAINDYTAAICKLDSSVDFDKKLSILHSNLAHVHLCQNHNLLAGKHALISMQLDKMNFKAHYRYCKVSLHYCCQFVVVVSFCHVIASNQSLSSRQKHVECLTSIEAALANLPPVEVVSQFNALKMTVDAKLAEIANLDRCLTSNLTAMFQFNQTNGFTIIKPQTKRFPHDFASFDFYCFDSDMGQSRRPNLEARRTSNLPIGLILIRPSIFDLVNDLSVTDHERLADFLHFDNDDWIVDNVIVYYEMPIEVEEVNGLHDYLNLGRVIDDWNDVDEFRGTKSCLVTRIHPLVEVASLLKMKQILLTFNSLIVLRIFPSWNSVDHQKYRETANFKQRSVLSRNLAVDRNRMLNVLKAGDRDDDVEFILPQFDDEQK